ncbi:MAG TPA: enoyl-CoA hydratase [Rhodospirillaceae bacterium]|jgi:enoyl-CoA hydratase/carnithine racemase|nr:enoyl-CoA hydratase [Rhodospirillaceae bacterium]MAX64813.1 enoyl-CoA hydratase [Rhodospirillaceae bacterium]MBB58789.1 enoyl-CoA hydratase [Rhodospirillaceae bacterium]HAE03251.1 enoyl-CoA hydratase [Rhodospirillaceae bacterium]|tara:strand:- start:37129 stop:37932 length:804 start_codon:yes stop_codon:yes gene_type:complete
MTDPYILYEKSAGIVTLTLNRPDQLNAFSEGPMIDAFLAVLDQVTAEKDVRCVILTGAGRAFSAGGNVKHMRDKTDMFAGSAADIERAYAQGIHRVPPKLWGLEIPVIAAVNGPAYGAALDLVCMCDIRLASATAKFGAPFVKIGIAPGDGAAWFLSRIVGPSHAAELILTGDTVDADTAKAMGLVSRVVDPDALMREAHALAEKIAANAPLALQSSKRLLRKAPHQTLEDHLSLCASYQALLHGTADHAEAVTALLEKRKPVFKAE